VKISLYEVLEDANGEFLHKITIEKLEDSIAKKWVIFDPFEKIHISSQIKEMVILKYKELQEKLENTENKNDILLEAIALIEPKEAVKESQDHCFFEKL